MPGRSPSRTTAAPPTRRRPWDGLLASPTASAPSRPPTASRLPRAVQLPGGVARFGRPALESPRRPLPRRSSVRGRRRRARDPATGALSQPTPMRRRLPGTSYDEPSRDCRSTPPRPPARRGLTADGRYLYVVPKRRRPHASIAPSGALRTGKVRAASWRSASPTAAASTRSRGLRPLGYAPTRPGRAHPHQGKAGCFTIAPGCTFLKGLRHPRTCGSPRRPLRRRRRRSRARPCCARPRLRQPGSSRAATAHVDGTDGLGMGAAPQGVPGRRLRAGNMTGIELSPTAATRTCSRPRPGPAAPSASCR